MLVAVPPAVEPMVSVLVSRALAGGPRLAKLKVLAYAKMALVALAPIVRLDAVPGLMSSLPGKIPLPTEEGTMVPVMLSKAFSTSWIVAVLPALVLIVTLPEKSVTDVAVRVLSNVMVLPLTCILPVGVTGSESVPAAKTSLVSFVAAGPPGAAVKTELTKRKVLLVGRTGPRISSAVAPCTTVEATVALVE